MRKKNTRATMQVRRPSRRKIQRHPRHPLTTTSIFPMAEARSPPKAPARVVLEKKKEYRRCASDRLSVPQEF
jgi:hypothetical protein